MLHVMQASYPCMPLLCDASGADPHQWASRHSAASPRGPVRFDICRATLVGRCTHLSKFCWLGLPVVVMALCDRLPPMLPSGFANSHAHPTRSGASHWQLHF